MSLKGILDPLPKPWCNISVNSIVGCTGGNAPEGAVGEYLSNYTTGNLTSTGVYVNFLSLPLSAGDYDVSLTSNWAVDNLCIALAVGISTDQANTFTDLIEGSNNARIAFSPSGTNQTTYFLNVPNVRISITEPTNVIAKITGVYSGAQPVSALRISARRVR